MELSFPRRSCAKFGLGLAGLYFGGVWDALGRLWRAHGRLLEASWALLGRSWATLGCSRAPLGHILPLMDVSKPHFGALWVGFESSQGSMLDFSRLDFGALDAYSTYCMNCCKKPILAFTWVFFPTLQRGGTCEAHGIDVPKNRRFLRAFSTTSFKTQSLETLEISISPGRDHDF